MNKTDKQRNVNHSKALQELFRKMNMHYSEEDFHDSLRVDEVTMHS